jgi:hypothetical protein
MSDVWAIAKSTNTESATRSSNFKNSNPMVAFAELRVEVNDGVGQWNTSKMPGSAENAKDLGMVAVTINSAIRHKQVR